MVQQESVFSEEHITKQLSQALGEALTESELSNCLQQIQFLEPPIGKQFWQASEATAGIYIILAGIVLPWAMLSKVDETGTAKGRLEPKGETFELDAPVGGTVAAIKAKEGQTVKAGQILVELESELPRAELQQAQARLEGHLDRLPQLELIKNQLQMTTRTQRLQTQSQASGQLAQISAVRQQIDFNKTASDLARKLLAKDEKTVQRFQKLQQQVAVSALQVDEAERRMIENQQRLQKAQSDTKQAQDELKKQQSIYDSTLQQGQLTVLDSERQIRPLAKVATGVL